ncbi:YIP1 family protein [Aquitalea magnusonii]|uniref:Uncharacterized protein DUF1282 n=1 Tax=Aquitalea magnusonii TaxID=332411 RepID=A0A318JPY9_9NEIS|nr:YIP1 family protein [Aquitalea magnusonii]PXX50479.1 uncharacterized protein DUF1282 [Aquitalea magnusonii]
MSPLSPLRMLWSSGHSWDSLSQSHPTLAASFCRLVLPGSLLGTAMILFAASFHGDVYGPEVSFAHWALISLLFMLTNWLAVPLMAWVIRQSVHAPARPAFADCYRLAAIAPLPIWLSTLTLLLPYPLFNMACGLLGLLASGALTYHGLDALFEHDDSVSTQSMAYTVFSVGALVWLFVVALLMLPLL